MTSEKDIVLKVENLGKLYQLGQFGTGTVSHDLNRWWAAIRGKEDPFSKVGSVNDRTQKAGKREKIWAIKDINFEVRRGEVLGIIGKNGAGKSTLLKLISNITAPTTGSIKAKGRIASLLEVGTGMHPEMTGRENVYLNGTILGMTRKEINKKFDEIMDFAGCAKYADTPVKRYSSGMKVRLGFAVAAFLEPEILIVDEVLAVGDAEFQKKAIGKMQDVSRNEGRTILFVSHNMVAVENLCTKGILIENGSISEFNDVNSVIKKYLNKNRIREKDIKLKEIKRRQGSGLLKFTDYEILNFENNIVQLITTGDFVKFRFFFTKYNGLDIGQLKFDIGINNEQGVRITWLSSDLSKFHRSKVNNCTRMDFVIDRLPLMPGRYSLTLFCAINGDVADWISDAVFFEVLPSDYFKTGKLIQKGNGDFIVDHHFVI